METLQRLLKLNWTLYENVRVQLCVLVERVLRKHSYPPDKQESATQTVLEQPEVPSEEWVGEKWSGRR